MTGELLAEAWALLGLPGEPTPRERALVAVAAGLARAEAEMEVARYERLICDPAFGTDLLGYLRDLYEQWLAGMELAPRLIEGLFVLFVRTLRAKALLDADRPALPAIPDGSVALLKLLDYEADPEGAERAAGRYCENVNGMLRGLTAQEAVRLALLLELVERLGRTALDLAIIARSVLEEESGLSGYRKETLETRCERVLEVLSLCPAESTLAGSSAPPTPTG